MQPLSAAMLLASVLMLLVVLLVDAEQAAGRLRGRAMTRRKSPLVVG